MDALSRELARRLGLDGRPFAWPARAMARGWELAAELATLRSQNEELTGAVQGMSTSGSSKTYELERDLATAMVNIQDLTSALEDLQKLKPRVAEAKAHLAARGVAVRPVAP